MSDTKSSVPEVVVSTGLVSTGPESTEVVSSADVADVTTVGLVKKHKIMILVGAAVILLILYTAHKRIKALEMRNIEITKMLKAINSKHGVKN